MEIWKQIKKENETEKSAFKEEHERRLKS